MITKIDHIGIAVRGLESRLPFWAETLGLDVGGIETVDSEQVKVAFLPVGEGRIELLEPTDDSSAIGRHLSKRGEGIHHLTLEVDNLPELLERLLDGRALDHFEGAAAQWQAVEGGLAALALEEHQVARLEHGAVGERRGAADDVLELAHVARPRISLQRRNGLFTEPGNLLAAQFEGHSGGKMVFLDRHHLGSHPGSSRRPCGQTRGVVKRTTDR